MAKNLKRGWFIGAPKQKCHVWFSGTVFHDLEHQQKDIKIKKPIRARVYRDDDDLRIYFEYKNNQYDLDIEKICHQARYYVVPDVMLEAPVDEAMPSGFSLLVWHRPQEVLPLATAKVLIYTRPNSIETGHFDGSLWSTDARGRVASASVRMWAYQPNAMDIEES